MDYIIFVLGFALVGLATMFIGALINEWIDDPNK